MLNAKEMDFKLIKNWPKHRKYVRDPEGCVESNANQQNKTKDK